jgi:hypothetical protein
MSREVTINEIWDEFVQLMERAEASEEDFHQYMVRYPSLIPVWLPQDNVVYSKFRLGSQHVADFAFCRDDSPGFRWHFIEIERPRDRLFNKSGDPTARLAQINYALKCSSNLIRSPPNYVSADCHVAVLREAPVDIAAP